MSAPDKSCKCPVCGGRARWSLMKTGRVCITQSDCCQVFARGDDGDQDMRDNFIGNERNERNVRGGPEAAEPVTNVQDGEGFSVWQT